MSTTTTSLTAEYEAKDRRYYDSVLDIEFIDLNSYLTDSFNEYILYITEHELKLTRKEKNKLGVHFIIKHLLEVAKSSKTKKWFYYRADDVRSEEAKLVKRIFNALPTNIIYDDMRFSDYIKERHYNVYKSKDAGMVSFQKFRLFLKRYELQQHEKEFLHNINIKLSLLP